MDKFLGTYDINDVNKRVGKNKIRPTHISLFSGCGGMDVGICQSGIETRVMVEWDKSCCNTLRANFHWDELKKRTKENGKPLWKNRKEMKKSIDWYHYREPVIIQKDIKEVTCEEILKSADLRIGECTVISGGAPCQGFSVAGKRMIDDPRNFLFKEMVRIIKGVLPVFMIFENVPGLASMNKGQTIKEMMEEFAKCGYDISWKILNAADFGVPQNRKRVFAIGKRIDFMKFPAKGNPQMCIAASPGNINHYEKWRLRHGIKLGILGDYTPLK